MVAALASCDPIITNVFIISIKGHSLLRACRLCPIMIKINDNELIIIEGHSLRRACLCDPFMVSKRTWACFSEGVALT